MFAFQSSGPGITAALWSGANGAGLMALGCLQPEDPGEMMRSTRGCKRSEELWGSNNNTNFFFFVEGILRLALVWSEPAQCGYGVLLDQVTFEEVTTSWHSLEEVVLLKTISVFSVSAYCS